MPSRRRVDVSDTEAIHPRAVKLDAATPRQLVQLLQQENRQAVNAVATVMPEIAAQIDRIAEQLRAGGRLIYVGAGSSGRLGALDAAECSPTFGTPRTQVLALIAGGPRALVRAVEGAEDDAAAGARNVARLRVGPSDFVCGISASGSTRYVHGALREARRREARTLLLCCNPVLAGRPLADAVIALPTGAELLPGSTRLKAGTATKLVLNALSTGAMVRLGAVHRGRMVDARATNQKLTERALRNLRDLGGIKPARARALLTQAGGWPRLALAILWSGRDAAAARALIDQHSLRELEDSGRPRRPRRN